MMKHLGISADALGLQAGSGAPTGGIDTSRAPTSVVLNARGTGRGGRCARVFSAVRLGACPADQSSSQASAKEP